MNIDDLRADRLRACVWSLEEDVIRLRAERDRLREELDAVVRERDLSGAFR